MSIHIKKINTISDFCGINAVNTNHEFKDYNVFFANNGSGKTSITRAFELLINKNSHIGKYQTINSMMPPEVSFLLKDDSSININSHNPNVSTSFNVEIYNSDFLSENLPLNGEFGLKKLDDKTVVLEGSSLGKESKELESLNSELKLNLERFEQINGNDKSGELGEISNIRSTNKELNLEFDKVRTNITTREIQITKAEVEINFNENIDVNDFNVFQGILTEEQEFSKLNDAIKKFTDLEAISTPNISVISSHDLFEQVFNFDKDKEAGYVSESIKEHLKIVGEKFIKDGRQLISAHDLEVCPFCIQEIKNNTLQEFVNYFNQALNEFDSNINNVINLLNKDIKSLSFDKLSLIAKLDKFKPFLSNFDSQKEIIDEYFSKLEKYLSTLRTLVNDRNGINDKDIFSSLYENITTLHDGNISDVVTSTDSILNDKKSQERKLLEVKSQLKKLRINKAKYDSFYCQKNIFDNDMRIKKLFDESKQLKSRNLEVQDQINKIISRKRPDIETINNYLIALNLSKYKINTDYKITINTSIIDNDNLRVVLSEGEKTTLSFAYFLARLKLFYNKDSLKNLVVVIDDPISSLDENRIYTTSYLVAKINQEIAGCILDAAEDKGQVFIFTHSHIFMTNIIRILGKHSCYYQLERSNEELKINLKNNVAGYFDSFFLLLFRDVYALCKNGSINEDYSLAINYGNKIRILIESFMKVNFISQFLTKEYRDQSVFDEKSIKEIIQVIKNNNRTHAFLGEHFDEVDVKISCESDLCTKLDSIIKGLHMDSHGSVIDYYSQHKTSLHEIQKFAKTIINIMMALNPNQTCFYIEAQK